MDVLALIDVDFQQLPADLRPHRDDRVCLDGADGPDLEGNRLSLDGGDRHRDGRPALLLRLLGFRLVARAGGERDAGGEQQRKGEGRTHDPPQCWSSGDRWATATGRARRR